MINYIFFCIFILAANADYYGPRFWPEPANVTYGRQNYIIDPCKITYKLPSSPLHFQANKQFYLIQVFHCGKAVTAPIDTLNVTLTVVVTNTSLLPPMAGWENYTLNASIDGKWTLKADYYPGFLRGFQTFSQLFKKNQSNVYYVEALPVIIKDGPQYQWRGIMIDTARHYLSLDTIRQTIDGCLYNKINVLHWHITDQDSFPLQIASRPELSKYGSFNGKVYTKANVAQIVQYALRRGVRVVPQIDSPAHTESWGRSPTLSNITLNCNGAYQGQFDPTLDQTYQVLTDVLREVNQMFIDPVIHFGGDEVDDQCWDQRPAIKQYMANNKIQTYEDLHKYYRKKQKAIWKTISQTKSITYWANQEINLPVDNDDYIQWWGVSENVGQLGNKTNKIILSNYDLTYLDRGFGGDQGDDQDQLETWRDMYSLQMKIKNISAKIVGGEACMWSQINNDYTQSRKIWLRASSIAQRFWKSAASINGFAEIADRLVAQGARMRERGIPVAPITVGLCENNTQFCFL